MLGIGRVSFLGEELSIGPSKRLYWLQATLSDAGRPINGIKVLRQSEHVGQDCQQREQRRGMSLAR